MSGMAREAGAARPRLTPVAVAGRVDRLSLIVLARRHLVRAHHSRHGCSVVELYTEPGVSGLWLVAISAGRSLSLVPIRSVATVQVMQGRVRAHRDGTGPAVLPGDLVLGPMDPDAFVAMTDAVVVVTGAPTSTGPVPA
jgi:hypothetical protein